MSIDVDKIIERAFKEMLERQQIRCPHCKEMMRNDDCSYPVSYHGEDPPEEMQCEECEETFFVKEVVTREYKVAKTEKGLEDL